MDIWIWFFILFYKRIFKWVFVIVFGLGFLVNWVGIRFIRNLFLDIDLYFWKYVYIYFFENLICSCFIIIGKIRGGILGMCEFVFGWLVMFFIGKDIGS